MTPRQREARDSLVAAIRELGGHHPNPEVEAKAQAIAFAWILRQPQLRPWRVLATCRAMAARDGCGCCEDIVSGLQGEAWEAVAAALLLAA